jgi:hypothetical protein
MKVIWYKDWQDVWTRSVLKATMRNLEFVRKNLALNGQCGIFTFGDPYHWNN